MSLKSNNFEGCRFICSFSNFCADRHTDKLTGILADRRR